ncbi:MAG: tetratricopeptide repeat protein [Hyphomicrobiales bacterium]
MKFRTQIVPVFAALLALVLSLGVAHAASEPNYVGVETCRSCHTSEVKSWEDSHHGWALRLPTPENVLGDFKDVKFEFKGITSRFFTKDGKYFVETDGADGNLQVFEIKYTVGVTPLQQYLVDTGNGHLQALDIAWDTIAKRWYHLYPNEDVTAGNGLHWTGPYKNWQARCAVCHQTDFQKNYSEKDQSYHSTWKDLTVACEACHGPGEAHVAWAKDRAKFDASAFLDIDALGFSKPKGPTKQAIEENMCGPCHSRREPLDANSTLPQSHLGDHFNLSTLSNGLYFADGQQHDEVYILGSFLQSKMHEKGVTCSNCHDPHSAKLLFEGNAVCTQCHNETGRAEFPTLKKRLYDSPEHTRHKAGSDAAQCVNCHMPLRNYMIVDGRRDHFFRVPDPMLSEKAGSPDACLTCHDKQKAAWAAEHIAKWGPPHVTKATAYGEAFAKARGTGLDPKTKDNLVAIALDQSQPAIVRATAAREIADQLLPADLAKLGALLKDESDLVRAAGARLQRQASPPERAKALTPLLSDPVKSVRLAAVLELTTIGEAMPKADLPLLVKVLDELRATYEARADFPETQMAMGGLAMTNRNWQAAEAAFQQASTMDPQLAEAWLARARIRAALGDVPGATQILVEAHATNSDNVQIANELASLLVSQGQGDAAIPLLRQVLDAYPDERDVRVTLAAALLRANKLTEARIEIDKLLAVAPTDANVLMLHAFQQLLTGNVVAARKTVQELSERYPGMQLPPQLQALLQMQ